MHPVRKAALFVTMCLSLSALGLLVASAEPRDDKIRHVAFVVDGKQKIVQLATPANRDDALGIRASVFEAAQGSPELALAASIGTYSEGGLICVHSRSGGMACGCGPWKGSWCVRVTLTNGSGPAEGPVPPPGGFVPREIKK